MSVATVTAIVFAVLASMAAFSAATAVHLSSQAKRYQELMIEESEKYIKSLNLQLGWALQNMEMLMSMVPDEAKPKISQEDIETIYRRVSKLTREGDETT